MPRIATLAIVSAALLSGCTAMQWAKQDVSAEQLGRDQQECQQNAWREASARYWFYQPMGPVFAPETIGRGFMVWPSRAVVDPFGHQLLEEARLAQFCMESKGYKLEPAPKK